MNIFSLGAQYQKFFGYEYTPKLDGFMTLIKGRPVLDVYELDKVLHAKHGAYEERGLSMETLIFQEYGQECLLFCKEAFAIE